MAAQANGRGKPAVGHSGRVGGWWVGGQVGGWRLVVGYLAGTRMQWHSGRAGGWWVGRLLGWRWVGGWWVGRWVG